MGLQCVSEDNILLPPAKLDYSSGISTCPFVLNGAPMSNRPTSLPNSGEFRRKAKGKGEDEYYTINLNTENIINHESFGNTTLRYESQNYTLNYIAIHKSIWNEGAEVSMVFTTPEFAILHICIPINLTKTDEDTNPFLTHWLYDDSMRPGFTVNELMNFSQETVSFAGIQYCLRYNNKANVAPYTLFMFKTPLNVNVLKCPAWITKLSIPSPVPSVPGVHSGNGSYMRKTADEIFNLMMHGHLTYYLRDVSDPKLISVESHFSGERTQNVVKPVMYSVKREVLYKKKKKIEGFGNMALQNVKCFPIDLNTQIDDNGQVIIDQTTNKPVDLASIDSSAYSSMDPTLALNAQNAALERSNNIRFTVVYITIACICAIIILVIVIYLFRGTSATAPVATAAVAVANASTNTAGLVRSANAALSNAARRNANVGPASP